MPAGLLVTAGAAGPGIPRLRKGPAKQPTLLCLGEALYPVLAPPTLASDTTSLSWACPALLCTLVPKHTPTWPGPHLVPAGKTTCAVFRMWSHWLTAWHKGDTFNQVFVTASATLQDQVCIGQGGSGFGLQAGG